MKAAAAATPNSSVNGLVSEDRRTSLGGMLDPSELCTVRWAGNGGVVVTSDDNALPATRGILYPCQAARSQSTTLPVAPPAGTAEHDESLASPADTEPMVLGEPLRVNGISPTPPDELQTCTLHKRLGQSAMSIEDRFRSLSVHAVTHTIAVVVILALV